jgi:hypothetical protein
LIEEVAAIGDPGIGGESGELLSAEGRGDREFLRNRRGTRQRAHQGRNSNATRAVFSAIHHETHPPAPSIAELACRAVSPPAHPMLQCTNIPLHSRLYRTTNRRTLEAVCGGIVADCAKLLRNKYVAFYGSLLVIIAMCCI